MRRSERGFSLLEAIIAITITTAVMLAATAAVTSAVHASTKSAIRLRLREDAVSALTQVRAATAYDEETPNSLPLLQQMIGRSSTMTTTNANGAVETITLAVSGPVPPGNANVIATATATQGDTSVTEQQTLFLEAPAPGTTVQVP